MNINSTIYKIISQRANDVCENITDSYLYDFNSIITGVRVDGTVMYAVAPNTFRGFHKTESAKIQGVKGIDIFKDFFTNNSNFIISSLKNIKSVEELDAFEDSLCDMLKKALKKTVKPHMLNSYNKLRKVIDLAIEHLVLMSNELSSERRQLAALLFLPLDSQIFQSQCIFSDKELLMYDAKRTFKYSDVYLKNQYTGLQEILMIKADEISKSIGMPFKRIYFDLIWNDRYKVVNARNLFMTNPIQN